MKVARESACHSTPPLTIGRYSRRRVHDTVVLQFKKMIGQLLLGDFSNALLGVAIEDEVQELLRLAP